MSQRPDDRELTPRHDWITPSRQPWVQSADGGVRINLPPGWSRRVVGEFALLVSPPDGGVTVGMVPGATAQNFHAVMHRLVDALARRRVLHHARVDTGAMDCVMVEGMGVDGETTVEWFVAQVGDVTCGVVLYGIGARSGYDRHLDTVRGIVRSVRPTHSGTFLRAEGNYPPRR